MLLSTLRLPRQTNEVFGLFFTTIELNFDLDFLYVTALGCTLYKSY